MQNEQAGIGAGVGDVGRLVGDASRHSLYVWQWQSAQS